MDIGHLSWPVALYQYDMTSLQCFLKFWLLESISIPYLAANSHALVTHVLTPHRCSLFSSLNTCLTILVSGRSWSRFRYDRAFIWQYRLGGIWPHSPTTITLLVIDFTFRTHIMVEKLVNCRINRHIYTPDIAAAQQDRTHNILE